LAVILAIVAIMAFPRFKEMLKRKDKMNSVFQENLIGIRVVKSFVREDHENEKFQNIAYKLFESQLKAERLFIVIMPSMQFVMYACMIAISWFGGNKIITGTMKTGEFMSFISYVVQILMSLMMLSMVFVMLVTSRASISRITELLDEQPDINDKGDSSIKNVPDGSFSYDNVSFRYGGDKGNLVLENINLSVRSGETVGIIGGTGSAKSTLVQILPRLYDVSSGSVSVGGHDVRDYDLTVLRDSVAMVLQKNVLFSGTIKENLRWGGPSATDEELIEACKAAQAHDFISAFPEGYDYYVEQGGVNLSGGQKQRLCIARALLKKPKIIIMDDSTSAVDTATDSKLRAGVRKYLQNTTTVIIAQRIASVIDADKIIVMDDGKVNAVGTPDELRRTNQIYREVYESQQKGVAENGRS
ncbi:MAG: ABC transporter ATP-binding protein, partial [Eubacteriales bacterium]|nr:ABC transporter ATP-binding protein [Eubacteriales bacterium]